MKRKTLLFSVLIIGIIAAGIILVLSMTHTDKPTLNMEELVNEKTPGTYYYPASVRVESPDLIEGESHPGAYYLYEYEYDENGNPKQSSRYNSLTDSIDYKYDFKYDKYERLTELTGTDGKNIVIEYDDKNNIITETDKSDAVNVNKVIFYYDANCELIKRESFENGKLIYVIENDGHFYTTILYVDENNYTEEKTNINTFERVSVISCVDGKKTVELESKFDEKGRLIETLRNSDYVKSKTIYEYNDDYDLVWRGMPLLKSKKNVALYDDESSDEDSTVTYEYDGKSTLTMITEYTESGEKTKSIYEVKIIDGEMYPTKETCYNSEDRISNIFENELNSEGQIVNQRSYRVDELGNKNLSAEMNTTNDKRTTSRYIDGEKHSESIVGFSARHTVLYTIDYFLENDKLSDDPASAYLNIYPGFEADMGTYVEFAIDNPEIVQDDNEALIIKSDDSNSIMIKYKEIVIK